MLTRRGFLNLGGLAVAAVVVPEPVRAYFDMGPAWKRHASGIVTLFHPDGSTEDIRVVDSLDESYLDIEYDEYGEGYEWSPQRGPTTGRQFQTPNWVMKEAMKRMEQNAGFAGLMASEYITNGGKRGATMSLRLSQAPKEASRRWR